MTDNIHVFKHTSIRIKAGNKLIYIDPFELEEAPHDADFILITHEHYDHFSPEDIEKAANKNTVLVCPENMGDKAGKVSGMVSRIFTVKPGTSNEIEGLEFETVPAYNLLKSFHPKRAGWTGYILKADNRRIYIAGDTDATDEAKGVKCDIALVPVGGIYTMNAQNAAELVNIICPGAAIPVHYGSIVGSAGDAEKFAELVKSPVKVEFKIKF